ncbi:PepSY-associated TM helix domain-containing protein, partial [Variovorax sp. HJSM1_2]|uniref:PepSY-associated TM helix domain-containing protein n=1 Tax=Variovorax sp. HJSM1_2 TaxID=3366263 RepID=UPI003BDC08E1
AVAVLTLPFLFMIAYTGLAISGRSFVPAPGLAAFAGQGGSAAFFTAINDPGKPQRIGQALAVPDMEPFVARAEQLMGQKVRAVVLDNPGDASMRIGIYGWNEDAEQTTRLSGTTGMVFFSAASGEVLRVRLPGAVNGGSSLLVQQVMGDLHMATFGGLAVKWLYFVCGLAGTAMMATGAILFMVKRRSKHGREFGAATAGVYRLVEGLNVAAIAGLAVACIAYLWANRLVPLGLPQRGDWEVRVFFAVWLLTLVHAFVRPPARAWVEQLWALAALCALLPLLNWLSTGDKLWAQIARNDWESAGVELTVLAFAVGSAWAARQAGRKRQNKATPKARPPISTLSALAETESA